MIENSPSGDSDDARSRWTYNSYGQRIFTKSRRFIVVKSGSRSCLAVPVTTYSGRGVSKNQIRKSDHCIAYSGSVTPCPRSDELPGPDEAGGGMQPIPIRIDPDDRMAKLDSMSRIDLSKPISVDHYNDVKNFGKVHPKSVEALLCQFRNVIGPSTIQITAAPSSGSVGVSERTRARHARAFDALIKGGISTKDASDYVNGYMRAERKLRAAARAEESDSEDGRGGGDAG